MPKTYALSIPKLVTQAIRQLTPFTCPETNWCLEAAGYSETLFCWKLSSRTETGTNEVIVGIPMPIALMALPRLDDDNVRTLWNAPDAYMTDLEELSRSMATGTHRLVIAPIHADGYGEITATALYLQAKP
jgi:hypothetical protein